MNELESHIVQHVENVGKLRDSALFDGFVLMGYPTKDVDESIRSCIAKGALISRGGFVYVPQEEPFPKQVLKVLDEVMGHVKTAGDCSDTSFEKRYDPVHYPKHYNKGKISVIDFCHDQDLNFDRGNAVKYICRAGEKSEPGMTQEEKAVQDLEKAIFYLKHEIEWIKSNGL